MDEKQTCEFCGSEETVITVGIAFGMGGYDFAFCQPCLDGMTAAEFLKKLQE